MLQQLLMSLFICIYVLEPCNDNEEDCPLKAAKGDCWKTAEPSSIIEKLCDPDRTFPLWVTCKKSCRRCNGKGWKTKRVQQLNICRYSYACYKHDDNDLFSGQTCQRPVVQIQFYLYENSKQNRTNCK